MPSPREIPIAPPLMDSVGHIRMAQDTSDPEVQPSKTGPRLASEQATPESAIQALMESPPFEAPPLSKDELGPVLDAVKDSLAEAGLTERESWIVHARIWRRMSVRVLARELNLSKTHTDRIYKVALGKLRAHLEENGTAAVWQELLGR